MASANIFSLGRDLGLWKPETPFVWYEVYGGPGSRYNSLREWRVLSLAAPSLGLKATGDPAVDRYPFSVKPDKPVAVETLMDIMRDGYQGTAFDLTEHAAFQVNGQEESARATVGTRRTVRLCSRSSRSAPSARPRAGTCSLRNCENGCRTPSAIASGLPTGRPTRAVLCRLRRRDGPARCVGSSGQFHSYRPAAAAVELPLGSQSDEQPAVSVRDPRHPSRREARGRKVSRHASGRRQERRSASSRNRVRQARSHSSPTMRDSAQQMSAAPTTTWWTT